MRMVRACLIVIAAIVSERLVAADEAPKQQYFFAHPVCYPDSNPKLKPIALKLAKDLNIPIWGEDGQSRNPVCCLWLEIGVASINEGYVIIHSNGGTTIDASDEKQMEAAIERFKKAERKTEKGWEFPVGLMTNFPVVKEAGAK